MTLVFMAKKNYVRLEASGSVLATLIVLGLTTTALPRAGGAGRLNVTPFYVGCRRVIVPLRFPVAVPPTVV